MSDKRRYPFMRRFEAALCFAVATSPRAYAAVGHALDPERMNEPGAELVVRAAQVVAKDHGSAPASREIVVQRIRSIVHEGRVTFERLQEAEALLDMAEDGGLADDLDAIIAEAAPIVRSFAGQDVVNRLVGSLSQGIDPAEMVEKFEGVAAIGEAREAHHAAVKFDLDSVTATFSDDGLGRLPTGIADVDRLLCGGLEAKALAVVLGTTGLGKSQFLTQVAVESTFAGTQAAYISLELGVQDVKRRYYANLCNMSFDEIAARGGLPELARRLRQVEPQLGRLEIAYFTPQVTTVQDVARWLKDRRRESGFDPRVLLFDMGDHLVSKVGTERSSYDDMRVVYDGMRSLAVERCGWAWTASHTTRGNIGRKRVNADQVADSAHKSRKADLILAMTQTEDDRTAGAIRYTLAKRRGDSDQADPVVVPTDLSRGRIAAISRNLPWG